MLRIQLMCKDRYYPYNDHGSPTMNSPAMLGSQVLVRDLAGALPGLVTNQPEVAEAMGGLITEEVQVDIRQFHVKSINTPTLEVTFELPEEVPTASRESVTDALATMVEAWVQARPDEYYGKTNIRPRKYAVSVMFVRRYERPLRPE